MDQKQTVAAALGVAAVVVAFVFIYMQMSPANPYPEMEEGIPVTGEYDNTMGGETMPIEEPQNPDDVTQNILLEGEGDANVLGEEAASADAMFQEDSQTVNNFDQVYDENEF